MRIPLTFAAALAVTAIAIGAGPATAAPGDTVFALTSTNTLVSFAPASPGTASAPLSITGLNSGETILAIDFRPANNKLYGLGSSSQLYSLDTTTGAATKVGATFTTPLSGNQFGFDFNPAVDRIRVVSDSGQNLRLHPDTGAVAAVDGSLAYKTGDTNATAPKAIAAAAYTNPDNDPATPTTLFDIDAASAVLARQDPPNDGALATVGSLGIVTSQQVAFDIGPNAGALLASRPNAGTGSSLYRVDLTTGKAIEVGAIGGGINVVGIAIRLEAAPAPPATTAPTTTAPAPPRTGNAGLTDSGSNGGANWLLLALGAAMSAVGAGTFVRQRSRNTMR